MGNDDLVPDGPVARSLWDHAADVVVDADRDGRILATNPAGKQWLGRAVTLQELVHPQDALRLTAALAGDVAQQPDPSEQNEPVTLRFAHLPPDAGWRVAQVIATRATGRGAVLVVRDTTRERRALATLDAHRDALARLAGNEPTTAVLDALARSVEHASGDARVVVLVARGTDLELAAAPRLRNDAAGAFTRVRGGAQPGRFPAAGALSGDLAQTAGEHGLGFGWVAPVLTAGGEPLAVLLLFPTTKRFPNVDEQAALEAGVPLAQVVLAADRARAVARSAARDDALTGVLGRPACLEELGNLARRSRDVLGILVVQVDDLAELNERMGFAVGDAVLTTVAARLGATVRGRDVLGRASGTRFVVACSTPGPASSLPEFAARVERGLAEPVVVRGEVVPVSIRVGSATRQGRVTDPGALVREAERALAPPESKDAGAGLPAGDEAIAPVVARRGSRRSGSGRGDR
jgi:diguanylate cyclase (GGDEF)-like protein